MAPPRDLPLDENGQGDAHLQFAFSAHRAVVDVDVELGLVRVVELATDAGGRQGDEPAGARGPDRGRHRPGPRPRAARGDPGQGRQGPERVVHRLPAAHDPRHAAGADRGPRARRPGGAVRPQGRGRAAATSRPRPPSSPRSAPPPAARSRGSRSAPSTSSGCRRPCSPSTASTRWTRPRSSPRSATLFEHSPWVARAAWRAGRSRTRGRAARRARGGDARRAPAERQLALIRAHPELAGREARAGELTRGLDERAGARPASIGLPPRSSTRSSALNRRLPRALRLPAPRLRPRAHEGLDPRVGRGAARAHARRRDRDRARRDREDRRGCGWTTCSEDAP